MRWQTNEVYSELFHDAKMEGISQGNHLTNDMYCFHVQI